MGGDYAGWGHPAYSFGGVGPSGGGVNFGKRKICGEKFGDDFFAFNDEEAEGFAVFFFLEGAEALEVGFGRHRSSKMATGAPSAQARVYAGVGNGPLPGK